MGWRQAGRVGHWRWGSRHGMMGYQTGDDGVPGRCRVTTLTNHQSGILHSLIFHYFNKLFFRNWFKDLRLKRRSTFPLTEGEPSSLRQIILNKILLEPNNCLIFSLCFSQKSRGNKMKIRFESDLWWKKQNPVSSLFFHINLW